MYIVIRIADANLVLVPMSHLFTITLLQYILRKTTSVLARSTHRYAGGMALRRLKIKMTRHESRRPSPKVTGPRVPEANL
jgi:hypothetical protein